MEAIDYIRKIKCVSSKDSVAGMKLDIQQVIRLMDGYHRDLVKESDSLPCVSDQRELLCAFFKFFRDNGEVNIGMTIEQFVDAFLAHNNR